MPKKLLLISICFYLAIGFLNLAFAQNTTSGSADYTTAGVGAQIKQYLCAPSDPEKSQTNLATNAFGGHLDSSGANNVASGDLYNCINRLYRFAIVTAAVVGVFFIVIAGYLYIGAGGNQESVDKAKSILASTVTSLVILFAGYILLKALNPDLIKFRPIQPPSVTLQPAYIPGFVPGSSLPGANGNNNTPFILAGYNIRRYATDANHENLVKDRYNNLLRQDLSTPEKVKSYMDRSAQIFKGGNIRSPLTGDMVVNAARNIDIRVLMAIMEVDSHYGVDGVAVDTCNPGNYGNTDSGQRRSFCPNWAAGVEAVANWLNNNRT
jgi:hypothetical protein